MEEALIGLCIVAVLLVCSCAAEEGHNTQEVGTIEVIGGGAVAGQAGTAR
jgi:hypothetical protein